MVAAALGNDVHDAADRTALFCRPAVLEHLKFLDRFVREILKQATDDVIFVVAAVNVDVDATAIAAVEGNGTDTCFRRVKVSDRTCLRGNDRQI